MSERDKTYEAARGLAIGAGRVMLSILVVYGFLSILMTASAQQSITANVKTLIGEDNKPVSYSEAYLAYSSAEAFKAATKEARATYALALKRQEQAEGEFQRLKPLYIQEQGAFSSFRERLAHQKLCDLSEVEDPMRDWASIEACASDLSKRDAAIWSGLVARKPNFQAVRAQVDVAQNAMAEADRNADRAKEGLAKAETDGRWAMTVARNFGDFDLLRQSWMSAWRVFEGFPPATMQILLAFMSGAFGALLIAQILVVYPHNQLALSRGQGFEARIGLGGMVAVCVYIVLGSGAVLLGDSSSLEGDANVMTFAGVGVLAGMFSDRVAAWLSDRANSFLGKKTLDAEAGDAADKAAAPVAEPPAAETATPKAA